MLSAITTHRCQFHEHFASGIVDCDSLQRHLEVTTEYLKYPLLPFQIHAIYRSSESVSVDKAQAEFANEFLKNQTVQRAAANAASAAVSSQLNNQAQNANRY